jgi:hypothetical protein
MATPDDDPKPPKRKSGGMAQALYLLLVPVAVASVGLLVGLVRYQQDQSRFLIDRAYGGLESASRQLVGYLDEVAARPPDDSGFEDAQRGKGVPAFRSATARWRFLRTNAGVVLRGCPDGQPKEGSSASCRHSSLRGLRETVALPDMADDLLLVEAKGRVLLRWREQQPAVANVCELTVPQKQTDSWLGSIFSMIQPSQAASCTNGEVGQREASVDVDGRERVLLCVPTSLVPEDSSGSHLHLCSLGERGTLDREAATVPSWILALMLIGLVLVLVAWPVLKLRFMAPGERLEAADVRLLILSGIVGAGFVTFLVLAVVSSARLRRTLDNEHRRFADQVRIELKGELSQSVALAEQYRPALNVPFPDVGQCARPMSFGWRGWPEAREHCPTRTAGPLLQRDATDGTDPNLWRSVSDIVAINSDGTPSIMCRRRSQLPGRPSEDLLDLTWVDIPPVRDRGYFRDVQANRLCDVHCQQVALDAVRTRTGRESAAAIVLPEAGSPGGRSMVVVAARLPSLIDAVPPPGLSFAMVDDSGLVLFHAEPARNLEENLFDECGRDTGLVAAVRGGRPATLALSCYGGRRYRVTTHPVRGTPWTLTVLRRTDMETAVDWLTATAWAVGFAIYSALFLAALGIMGVARRRFRAEWLWPREGAQVDYVILTSLFAIGFLGLGWITPPPSGLCLVAILLGSPVVAIGLTRHFLKARPDESPPERLAWLKERYKAFLASKHKPTTQSRVARLYWRMCDPRSVGTLYVCMLTALLAVLAVWPAYALFCDARTLAVEAFGKMTQAQVALRDEHDGDGVRTGHVYYSELLGGTKVDSAAPSSDAYDDAPNFSGLLGALIAEVNQDPAGPSRFLLPAGGEIQASMSRMSGPDVPGARWTWQRIGDRLLMFINGGERRAPEQHVKWLEMTLPGWRPLSGWRVQLVLLIAALVALAASWPMLRFIVDRLFLLNLDRDNQLTKYSDPTFVLIWISPAEPNPSPPPDTEVHDPRSIPQPASPGVAGVDPRTPVVVDHLAAGLADPDLNKATLDFLEPRVREPKATTILISQVNPIHYLGMKFAASEPTPTTEQPDEHKNQTDSVVLFWRWVRLLSSCQLCSVRVSDLRDLTADVKAILPARLGNIQGSVSDEFFWGLWGSSTKSEKLAMIQLAEEGFLSPGDLDAARSLMERGIVQRRPAFEFYDHRFRNFVLRAEPAGTARIWERELSEGGAAVWNRISVPLLVTLAVVVGFIFLTQPAIYASGAIAFGLLSAVVPAAAKLVGNLTKPAAEWH